MRRISGGESTVHAKARAIENALGIASFDPRWTLPSMAEKNPLVWMVEVDGLLVDLRGMSRGPGDCLRKRIDSLYSGGSANTIVNGTILMEDPPLKRLRKEAARANAMTRARYHSNRSSGKTTQKNISEKLRDIATDIKERGHANLTRLTVLKKWFEAPCRIMSFGAFIAIQASRPTRKTTKKAEQLLCEAREILAKVDLFVPKIPNDRAKRLHARLEAFQDERQNTQWASVRIIITGTCFSSRADSASVCGIAIRLRGPTGWPRTTVSITIRAMVTGSTAPASRGFKR